MNRESERFLLHAEKSGASVWTLAWADDMQITAMISEKNEVIKVIENAVGVLCFTWLHRRFAVFYNQDVVNVPGGVGVAMEAATKALYHSRKKASIGITSLVAKKKRE